MHDSYDITITIIKSTHIVRATDSHGFFMCMCAAAPLLWASCFMCEIKYVMSADTDTKYYILILIRNTGTPVRSLASHSPHNHHAAGAGRQSSARRCGGHSVGRSTSIPRRLMFVRFGVSYLLDRIASCHGHVATVVT